MNDVQVRELWLKLVTLFAARSCRSNPLRSSPTVTANGVRLRRHRLPVGSFRHEQEEDRERDGGSGAQRQERRRVSKMIDDLAGGQPAHGGADALGRGDGPKRQVVASRASHNIGDHKRRQRTENPGADAVEHWTPTSQKLLSERV